MHCPQLIPLPPRRICFTPTLQLCSGQGQRLSPQPGCCPTSPFSLQVPFLSVGGDIGVRTVRHCDSSPLSGEYVVEDVKGDDACYFRRLVFLSNRNVVQSEARLLAPVPPPGTQEEGKSPAGSCSALSQHGSGSVFALCLGGGTGLGWLVPSKSPCLQPHLTPCPSGQKKRRKDKKKAGPAEPPTAIDKSYLCCEHHKAMVAGLCLLGSPDPVPGDEVGRGIPARGAPAPCQQQFWGRRVAGEAGTVLGAHPGPLLAGSPIAVLVVGLGGGSLPLFIHDYFSQAQVAVVEIDPCMLEVATCWFGFSQGERMQVHVADGLDYVATLAAEGTVSQSVPARWGGGPGLLNPLLPSILTSQRNPVREKRLKYGRGDALTALFVASSPRVAQPCP